jgi:hypothetical protein
VGLPIVEDSNKATPFDHVVLGPQGTPVTVEETPIGRVQAYTLGYEREVPLGFRWLKTGLGIQATTYGMPSQLKAVYGNRPATIALFLKLRPAGNMQEHMKQMHH